jgi:CRISP-associated protein Cas1
VSHGLGRPHVPGATRILDLSSTEGPRTRTHLSLRYRQLVIAREGMPDVTVPMEEIAVAILASRHLTCSLAALDGLVGAGAAVMVCDEAMRPSGLLLPLVAHFQHTQRVLAQVAATEPVKKRVWQQIVVAKILAQGSLLSMFQVAIGDAGLKALAARVRSGDPDNLEAQAAQRYWVRLFGDAGFRRQRHAPDQNRYLNYGYAVLRATVARAIVATGLHTALGVHHHGRQNPFCLADDLMEPYRPLIDGEAAAIEGEWGGDAALDGTIKQRLVGVLHERLVHADAGLREARPVIDWITRSAVTLAESLAATRASEVDLFFPSGLLRDEHRSP